MSCTESLSLPRRFRLHRYAALALGFIGLFLLLALPRAAVALPLDGAHLTAAHGTAGRPVVTITRPTRAKVFFTNHRVIRMRGTARSKAAIVKVTWRNSRGGKGRAIGTRKWRIRKVTLKKGRNVLTVTARDRRGRVGRKRLTVTRDTVAPTVAATPPGGTYLTPTTIILAASEPCRIYYTLDGSVPSRSSSRYATPLTVRANLTVKFIAFDRAGNASAIQTQSYTIATAQPPALLDATVDKAVLTLTYDKTLDEASVPAAADFAVRVAGAARGVSAVAVKATKVTLTLASAVTQGQTVTLSYAPGAKPIKGTSGLPAAAVAARGVSNATVTFKPPPIDPSVPVPFYDSITFLFTGPNAVQQGVAAGTIDPDRAAVVRGRVTLTDGTALKGVTVEVVDHPEYGHTVTRDGGWFDMAVNGGGTLSAHYVKAGYPDAMRQATVPVGDYTVLEDLVLLNYDTKVTSVTLGSPTTQVAQGSPVKDQDGARTATLIVPKSTAAQMVMPSGARRATSELDIRATEFSVGENGEAAMPAVLPPTSAYTYCIDLSADQATAVGAETVAFAKALPFYVENFIGFPIGETVPVGYFDADKNAWVASKSGLVVKILAVSGGKTSLDIDGSGVAASATALAALGVTDEELAQLAKLYSAGQSLWRVPVKHFSSYDCNWPSQPPSDARPPKNPPPKTDEEKTEECVPGSVIGVFNQTLGEEQTVFGTPYTLVYSSPAVPGYTRRIRVQATGAKVPASCKKVKVTWTIGGQTSTIELDAEPGSALDILTGGSDPYGRPSSGGEMANISVGYDYAGVYGRAPEFGLPAQTTISGTKSRADYTYWQSWTVPTKSCAAAPELGGWRLDQQHSYDPVTGSLDGEPTKAVSNQGGITASSTISTAAGIGDIWFRANGDGGLAIKAILQPSSYGSTGLIAASDGSLLLSDLSLIRRIVPNGIVDAFAGGGPALLTKDALATSLDLYPSGLAKAADGSVYALAGVRTTKEGRYTEMVLRIGPDGRVTRVAGGGTPASGNGDGGPATAADISGASDIALGPGNSLYILQYVDNYAYRVRKVAADGIIRTFVGGGTRSSWDIPATEYVLQGASSIAVGPAGQLYIGIGSVGVAVVGSDGIIRLHTALASGVGDLVVSPDGSLFVADTWADLVKRIATDGTVSTVAGGGSYDDGPGDGGPATEASLRPRALAVKGDGTLYVLDDWGDNGVDAERPARLRMITPSGIISTIAGAGHPTANGDGLPATHAAIHPSSVAVGGDGNVYVGDLGGESEGGGMAPSVRVVGAEGTIRTLAGGGDPADGVGDGGLATAAKLLNPEAVAAGQSGSVYVLDSDQYRIRQIGRDGVIRTIAGTGRQASEAQSDLGVAATAVSLNVPRGLSVAPDGTVYFIDDDLSKTDYKDVVYRISPNGILWPVCLLDRADDVAIGPSGSLFVCNYDEVYEVRPGSSEPTAIAGGGSVEGFSADGGPALDAALHLTGDVEVSADGAVYVGDMVQDTSVPEESWQVGAVRRIGSDGIITTVAGGPEHADGLGDGGPASKANFVVGDLAVCPNGDLLIADSSFYNDFYPSGSGGRVRRISYRELGSLSYGERLVPSVNGNEAYVFDVHNKHVRTVDTLTGAVQLTLGYDSAGRLASLTDAYGNATQVERDSAGGPTAIVAPGGQRTSFLRDGNGLFSGITCPVGNTAKFTYTPEGLMTSYTDRKGGVHTFTYNDRGRLTKDENPAGGSTTLARTELGHGFKVTATTAEGRTTTYSTQTDAGGTSSRSVTQPSGAKATQVEKPDGSSTVTYADGTVAKTEVAPDPRFGMAAPFVAKAVVTTPGGITSTTTRDLSAALSDPGDPLSLDALTLTETVNGDATTTTYDAALRTISRVSPEGRRQVFRLDTSGQVVSSRVGGADATDFAYTAHGKMRSVSLGGDTWTFDYDPGGWLASVTRPDGAHIAFTSNAAGLTQSLQTPSAESTDFTYDTNGELTGITSPAGKRYALQRNAVERITGYTLPGGATYRWTYDRDGKLSGCVLPGGRTIACSYDSGGRLVTTGPASISYGDLTTRPATVSRSDQGGSGQLHLSYDGPYVTSCSTSGDVTDGYTYRYGTGSAHLVGITPAGGSEIGLRWDGDGLLLGYGPFTWKRDSQGAETDVRDGTGTKSYTYDSRGRLASVKLTVNGKTAYVCEIGRSGRDDIISKGETIAGVSLTTGYEYDGDGQLIGVSRGGKTLEAFSYDADGNRVAHRRPDGSAEAATYDVQDRLRTRGAVAYTWDSDGFLASRGGDSFTYDATGELLSVRLQDGRTVHYVYDPLGRRVRANVGSQTYTFSYRDLEHPHEVTAVTNPDATRSEFYYDDEGRLLAFRRGGAWYYVGCDQLGSPRVVCDAAGNVVKTVDYGAYGEVLNDSAQMFALPFGFAGGLLDPFTGLLHFGARDYDPPAGRWLARDPIGLSGGQLNPYTYCGNDPVAWRDPSGLLSWAAVESFGWKVYGIYDKVSGWFGKAELAVKIWYAKRECDRVSGNNRKLQLACYSRRTGEELGAVDTSTVDLVQGLGNSQGTSPQRMDIFVRDQIDAQ